MASQCPCATGPFNLNSTAYIVGQTYYLVIDGCSGNVCDYAIDVVSGSMSAPAPANPGVISGPNAMCIPTTSGYSIPAAQFSTIYNWTLNPPGNGTIVGTGNSIGVDWEAGGPTQICVETANGCNVNGNPSCKTVNPIETPTAAITGFSVDCSAGDASIDVGFTGSGPFTFSYTLNNVVQPDITTTDNPYVWPITQTGTYELTGVKTTVSGVTCTGTVSGDPLLISVDAIEVDGTVEAAACSEPNGNIFINVEGGLQPLTFLWDSGDDTQDLENIFPGNYTLTVTDAAGCSVEFEAEVEDNQTAVSVFAGAEPNIGCGPYTGSLALGIDPPFAPAGGDYTIIWSNSDTEEEIFNLAPGDYGVTVSSGTCEVSDVFTVPNQAVIPILSFNESTPAYCGINNGTITIDIMQGIAPFTFLWSNDSFYQNLGSVGPGTYTLTVTGQVGCTATIEATVGDDFYDFGVLENLTSNTSCTNPNGSIVLNTNPLPNDLPNGLTYSYLWENGDTTKFQNNLEGGIYPVTVSIGLSGCEQVFEVQLDNDYLLPTLGTLPTKSICNQANGAIDLTVDDPSPPFTYNWSTGATTEDISGLVPGNYLVTVTNSDGCTVTETTTILNQNINFLVQGIATANTSCNAPTGSIDMNVLPVSQTFTYVWSSGQTTGDIFNLTNGSYTVTVSAGGTCTDVKTFTVDNLTAIPQLTEIVTPATCGQSDGSINLTPVPPSLAPFTFAWADNATTEDRTGLAPGNYTVTVTGNNGCTHIKFFQVAGGNPNLKVTSMISPTKTCGSPDGSIELDVSPANFAPFTFLWSDGQNEQNRYFMLPGNYSVTISPANSTNCPGVYNFTIPDERPQIVFAKQTVVNAFCGDPNGVIKLQADGTSDPYFFQWETGETTEFLEKLGAGTYKVSVTDAAGCLLEASFDIVDEQFNFDLSATATPNSNCLKNNGAIDLSINPPATPNGDFYIYWQTGQLMEDLQDIPGGDYEVVVSAGGNCSQTLIVNVPSLTADPQLSEIVVPAVCGAAVGSIDLTADSGNPPYTFDWSNAAKTEDLANLAPGNYAVTVAGTDGCTATKQFQILDEKINIAATGAATANTACQNFNGNLNLNVAPANPNYQFDWSNSAKTQNLVGVQGGQYTVTISLGSCQTIQNFTIAETPDFPKISAVVVPDTCNKSLGSIDVDVAGGGGTSTNFTWSSSQTTQDIGQLVAGDYTFSIIGANGCAADSTFFVGNTSNTFSFTGTPAGNTDCATPNGSINLVLNPPTGAYIFNWSNTQTTQNLSGLPPGNYAVTIDDGSNCTAEANFQIENDVALPTLVGTASDNSRCDTPNGSINLQVNPPSGSFTFNWSNNFSTQNLTGLAAGNFTVVVTDANNCTATETFSIINNVSLPQIAGTTTAVKCFGETSGAINFNVSSGQQPFNFNWSPAVANPAQVGGGNYFLTVTDAAGCTASQNFTVAAPAAAVSLVCQQVSGATAPGASDGKARLTLGGGTAPFSISWSGGGSGQQVNLPVGIFNLDNLTAGAYNLTITDANGCTEICDFQIADFNCAKTVGTMQLSTVERCGDVCLSAGYDATGQQLAPGDALQFILHEGSAAQIVNEIVRSQQPDFCFDASKMVFDKTYFISAVVGAVVSGNVNLSDICTQVSVGTPVVFHAIPQAQILPHGDFNCADSLITLVGQSSVDGATFSWTASAGGQISGATNLATALADAIGNFQLILDNAGCRDTATTSIKNVKNQIAAAISNTPTTILDCQIRKIDLTASATGSQNLDFTWLWNGDFFAKQNPISIDQAGKFELIATDPLTFCADTTEISISDIAQFPPVEVQPTTASLTCLDTLVELTGSSTVPNLTFQWWKIVGADTTLLTAGANLTTDAGGTFLFTGLNSTNNCRGSKTIFIPENKDLPTVDAGADFVLNCLMPQQFLAGSGASGTAGGTVNFQWFTSDGSLVSATNTAAAGIDAAGNYELIATDPTNGCSANDFVEVTTTAPTLTTDFVLPDCKTMLGSIVFIEPTDGTAPYKYSIDGGQKFSNSLEFKNLKIGTYDLVVQDALGCEDKMNLTLPNPQQLEIDLNQQVQVLTMGQTFQMNPLILNGSADSLASILWSPAVGLSCSDCLDPVAMPLQTIRYKLEIADSAGCRAEAFVTIEVKRGGVVVPNAFNPDSENSDNQKLTIFADLRSVSKVKSFQIFDRWGDKVFEAIDLLPNDLSIGWDGKSQGKPLQPAVFVWVARVVFIDGVEETFKGDLLLTK